MTPAGLSLLRKADSRLQRLDRLLIVEQGFYRCICALARTIGGSIPNREQDLVELLPRGRT